MLYSPQNTFPCLRVIFMAYNNNKVMYKVYYYSIMKNRYIQKSCYDLENNDIFPVSISPLKIWKLSEDEEDDAYYMDTNDNEISDYDFLKV